jgi:hypothetical protein
VKSDLIYYVGHTLVNVIGIVVLECRPFDGGGGAFVVPCPAGTPSSISYCVESDNDGVGNHVLLGVLELNPTTAPNAVYGPCAAGTGSGFKSQLIRSKAGPNLGNVNGIIITACRAADGPQQRHQVACPTGSFFAACYVVPNDGAGNHVEFGVTVSGNSGDPYGQYGGYGPGSLYRLKSRLVTDVGRSLDKVDAIIILRGGTIVSGPEPVHFIPCGNGPDPYTYCVGSFHDPSGSTVFAGVIERP